MAPTIIYFIKGGNKGSNGRTKTGRKSKAKNSRLHVGYCLRDWCKVFYEPTDRDIDDDEAAVPAIYRFLTKQGSRHEPAEGEIAFLPHFDPKHIQNTNKKQREEMQKRYLNAAYKFLDADDEQIDDLIEEYTDKSHRHWQSWFDEAIKWKKSRANRRDRRRARRVEGIEAAGIDPHDVEGLSDTSDDSAYETDSDNNDDSRMRPPARPAPRGTQRHGHGHSGSGIGSSNTTRRRPAQSPLGGSSGLSGISRLGRRLGRSRPNRLGGQLPLFSEDSDDNDGDFVMSGGVGGSPGPSPRGGLVNRTRGLSSGASDNGFVSGVERLESEHFDRGPPEASIPQPRAQDEDAWMPEDHIAAYQGQFDEEEALHRAMRESQAPEPPLPTPQSQQLREHAPMQAADGYMDGDYPGMDAAIRAGTGPENRLPQPTVEDANDVDEGGVGGDGLGSDT